MNQISLAFEPIVPVPALVVAALLAVALAAVMVLARTRGAWFRVAALGALLLALLNPVVMNEEREALRSTVALVVDRSQSQAMDGRPGRTDAIVAALQERLARFPDFEVRTVETASGGGETRLFEALDSAVADVPRARLAGSILVTDGRAHDVPATGTGGDAGEGAGDGDGRRPIHAILTGREDERDRRIEIVAAPRFGIVGEAQEIVWRVEDDGTPDGAQGNAVAGAATVEIRVNGETLERVEARPGAEGFSVFEVPRGGRNIVEVVVDPVEGEITAANNRAVATLDGIREALRVLLVSGEPHSGERAWRNLLKADPGVDLVHFTILRPPEKQDGTPINELSLIAFPTRELFLDKIDEFDLIVFDRYQRRGVLPSIYFDNIARYVEDGGALLVAAGPDFAGPLSLASTPLFTALPAFPSGTVTEEGFHPRLSEDGRRHPVTRELPGAGAEPPDWGRWFRSIDVATVDGDVVLEGADERPLLVLNRYGEGRVALMLSDHGWLWSRGFEGGGPHVPLYRRLAHWLMGEPELEEEALTATARGGDLVIARQTMGEEGGEASVIAPDGSASSIPLAASGPGRFEARVEDAATGLWQVANGELRALAYLGDPNAPELRRTVSTDEVLAPVAARTGGAVLAGFTDGALDLPNILPVRAGAPTAGSGWIGLQRTGERVLRSATRLPLLSGFLGLALLLLALGGLWWREGR